MALKITSDEAFYNLYNYARSYGNTESSSPIFIITNCMHFVKKEVVLEKKPICQLCHKKIKKWSEAKDFNHLLEKIYDLQKQIEDKER